MTHDILYATHDVRYATDNIRHSLDKAILIIYSYRVCYINIWSQSIMTINSRYYWFLGVHPHTHPRHMHPRPHKEERVWVTSQVTICIGVASLPFTTRSASKSSLSRAIIRFYTLSVLNDSESTRSCVLQLPPIYGWVILAVKRREKRTFDWL